MTCHYYISIKYRKLLKFPTGKRSESSIISIQDTNTWICYSQIDAVPLIQDKYCSVGIGVVVARCLCICQGTPSNSTVDHQVDVMCPMRASIDCPSYHICPRRGSHKRAAMFVVPVTKVSPHHIKDQCKVVTGVGLWFGHVGVEGDWVHGGGGWVCDQSEETTYKIPIIENLIG